MGRKRPTNCNSKPIHYQYLHCHSFFLLSYPILFENLLIPEHVSKAVLENFRWLVKSGLCHCNEVVFHGVGNHDLDKFAGMQITV